MYIIKNSLGLSHEFIQRVIEEGDTVVDATAGNGNDTVMLAELVGEKGRVYSFDIQEKAINNTSRKLDERKLTDRVILINDGHENMDKYLDESPKAVMFNLGYLPGGDHSIGTRYETTVKAIEKAMDIILEGGVISIVIYYGGESGFEEKEKVVEYINSIEPKRYIVMKTEFVNQINCPPILVLIQKIS